MSMTGTTQMTGTEQPRRWQEAGGHQQPAGCCAGDGESPRWVYPLPISHSAGGDEVVEDVLFVGQHAGLVPRLPYGLPPRRLASASTPPCSSQMSRWGAKEGVWLMLKPPQPEQGGQIAVGDQPLLWSGTWARECHLCWGRRPGAFPYPLVEGVAGVCQAASASPGQIVAEDGGRLDVDW